jgi:hypothetical protein
MQTPIVQYLLPFHQQLGKAYMPYLNHATRVFHIARTLDHAKTVDVEKLAIACAFHDLGIWTHHTWDYLHPSEQLCREYLDANGRSEWADELLAMIRWHHKLLPYSGPHAASVELFRKADLVDFSAGIVRFGIKHAYYKTLTAACPLLGFHTLLLRKFGAHMLRRPWNPLPMVRI